MTAFAVYEQTASGKLSWKFTNGSSQLMGGSSLGHLTPWEAFKDRETAERIAEASRQQNAKNVEATKRRRKYKTEPATYTVVDASSWVEERGHGLAPPWPKGAFGGFVPPSEGQHFDSKEDEKADGAF